MQELRVRQRLREGGTELRETIYRILAPSKEIVERTVNPFRSMLLVAPMNRGKTSWAEAILGETVQWLLEDQGLDESQVAYVYAEAANIQTIVSIVGREINLAKTYYLFIFADDEAAAEGAHGRRAASQGNVEVSRFYIRIRHELRRKYGYTRAVTAIHATQVYHLLDKTFREAADIDVVKALPKSEADRKAIARLMVPEYVPAVFGLLRRLGRQRVLARTLREFLEAIYTAVVILDGVPYVVKAYRDPERIAEETTEKKQWLRRVQHLELAQGTEAQETQDRSARDHEEFNEIGSGDAQLLEEMHRGIAVLRTAVHRLMDILRSEGYGFKRNGVYLQVHKHGDHVASLGPVRPWLEEEP